MPIRVVRIIDRLNIGGPAKHVTWLAAGLDPSEFETAVITGTVPPGEGDMTYFAREAGIEPLVIPEMSRELSPRDLLVVLKIIRMLFRLRPQIVHTHKAKAGAVGRMAAFVYSLLVPGSCRVVHTYHGHIFHSYYGPAKTGIFLAIERVLARIVTDRIVTISRQQQNEISSVFRVGRPNQHTVIPLGLDFSETSAQSGRLRAELNIGQNVPLIGIAGRLCEVKNHRLFLEAAAILRGEGLEARYVIIGDGELREDLETRAAELGVNDVVHFTGFRRDAISLYGDLDIAALTSLNEGTPLTLIEALSCGVPAVSTEVGGVVDLMGERHRTNNDVTVWTHGVTSPSGNAATFAKALRYLIERPEERRDMGKRGCAFVRANLSKERLINDIENLYRELSGELRERGENGERTRNTRK